MTPRDSSQLTNRIRRLRFDHGEMTQEELAKRAGVTRQTIHALESGKYAPSLPLALRIAHVFNTTVENVFQLNGCDEGDGGGSDNGEP
jgi:putative transcriptional regulator